MNEYIYKRKSVRKYDMTKLDDGTLEKVREKIEKLVPLYPGIRFSVEIVSTTKGLFNVKAPHYLVFSSEEKEGAYENIGFVGQQLDLFFSESGIGACWLGVSKPEEKVSADGLSHVICMSFGKPDGALHRTSSEFKRKPAEEISEGSDKRLEAARLAPSATNAQNWYFAAQDGKIHCYRKKSNPLLGFLFDKMHIIDMGIAICHIAEESEAFSFSKEAGVPERKGHVYTGTVG
jgi:nitroreductase